VPSLGLLLPRISLVGTSTRKITHLRQIRRSIAFGDDVDNLTAEFLFPATSKI
jgi:hypothetical protein